MLLIVDAIFYSMKIEEGDRIRAWITCHCTLLKRLQMTPLWLLTKVKKSEQLPIGILLFLSSTFENVSHLYEVSQSLNRKRAEFLLFWMKKNCSISGRMRTGLESLKMISRMSLSQWHLKTNSLPLGPRYSDILGQCWLSRIFKWSFLNQKSCIACRKLLFHIWILLAETP